MLFKVNLEDPADEGAHPILVCSCPVDPPTRGATVELGPGFAHARGQEREDVVAQDGFEGLVAPEAAGKRPEEISELEPPDDFQELYFGVFGPDHERACETRIGGEGPVSREQDAGF